MAFRILEDIRRQTIREIEVLLVNDGSKDGSGAICRRFCAEDARFRYLEQENAGAAAARNTGIRNVRGDYICFLDSDDRIGERYLAQMLTAAEKFDADVTVCGIRQIEEAKEPVLLMPPREEVLTLPEFAGRFWDFFRLQLIGTPWNKLFRRSVVTPCFPQGMKSGEDLVFVLSVLPGAGTVAFTDTCSYDYHIYSGDIKKYNDNNTHQCVVYSCAVRTFLSRYLPEEAYLAQFEAFFIGNICRDAYTLSRSNSRKIAKQKLLAFYNESEITGLLQKKAWKSLPLKYRLIGALLTGKHLGTIIALSRLKK